MTKGHVNVFVSVSFSTTQDGSYGQGVQEMRKDIANKYPMFVTILDDDEKPEKVVPRVAPTTTRKVAPVVRKGKPGVKRGSKGKSGKTKK